MTEVRRELLNVCSVDPGGTTGVMSVIVPMVDGRLRYSAVESLSRARSLGMTHGAEFDDPDWKEHADVVMKAVHGQRKWVKGKADEIGYDGYRQVLIVEGFVGSDSVHTSDVFSPIRIEAVIRWLISDVVEEYRTPLPAEKAQITDDRLKLWGWYTPGKPHLNDARRHLFVYLRSMESFQAPLG